MNPYADFVMQVDHHMGDLFKALKSAGMDDNTLVFFTSDNGCSREANFPKLKSFGHDPSGGYRGSKSDIHEGGHRVPLIARWPNRINRGQNNHSLVCLTDLYTTLARYNRQRKWMRLERTHLVYLPLFDGKQSNQKIDPD